MLHIVPQRRPTATQILRHPWIQSAAIYQEHALVADPSQMTVDTNTSDASTHDLNAAALKGAVAATFRAIASPQAANVGPVGQSELARRRARDKPSSPSPMQR